MPTKQEIKVCYDLGLDPIALYDEVTASQKLSVSPHTLKVLRQMGRLTGEKSEQGGVMYRGWHIAERALNRREYNERVERRVAQDFLGLSVKMQAATLKRLADIHEIEKKRVR